ncbi:MAG: flagellar biosynthetic protein FliO [Armatimonadota bacterium]
MKKLLALAVLLVGPPTLAEQQYIIYVTKSGDGLYSIARRFGTTPAELIRLNNIQNPDKLYRGMRLKVPAPPPAVQPYAKEPRANAKATAPPAQPAQQSESKAVRLTPAKPLASQPAAAQAKADTSKPGPRQANADPSRKAAGKQSTSFLPDYTSLQEAKGPESLLSLIGGVVLKLGLVLILVWICAKAMRALSLRSYRGPSGARMAVLDTLALGPNRGLYIVRVVGRYLLLGVTNERIHVLSELPSDAVPDETESERCFGGILDRFLGGDPTSAARVGSLLDRTAQHLRRRAQDAQEGAKSWES